LIDFSIHGIVDIVGESISISGVSRTLNTWGDATETYTAYYLSGVVQVNSGDEESVPEGIIGKEDIIIFVDTDETNANQLKLENYVTISETTSGVFRIVNVINNPGHYEVWAKKTLDTSP
jgi:hypothetical protein